MSSRIQTTTLVAALICTPSVASAGAVLLEAQGPVQIRNARSKTYAPAKAGVTLADGARLKTGAKARAALRYPDGSVLKVRADTEVIVRAPKKVTAARPSGVVLFLGRVWAKVAKHAGGDTHFEVRSANAVAGVRGTELEVAVALSGAAMVQVTEGTVAVDGEGKSSKLGAGYTVVANHGGALSAPEPNQRAAGFDGWMVTNAKTMQTRGLQVAKGLHGRLNRKKAAVEGLVAEQKALRTSIEGLAARRKRGEDVAAPMAAAYRELEAVTARLERLAAALQGAFALFDRWGEVAAGGAIADSAAIADLAGGVARVAADFADMIADGTDLSEASMDSMIDDMSDGKMMGPGDSAADELFGR